MSDISKEDQRVLNPLRYTAQEGKGVELNNKGQLLIISSIRSALITILAAKELGPPDPPRYVDPVQARVSLLLYNLAKEERE